MPQLPEQVKRFMVMHFAMHETPSEVAAAVAEEFKIKIDRMQAQKYNPDAAACTCSKKLKKLFVDSRKKFEEHEDGVIAKKAYRFKELLDQYRLAKSRKNIVVALAALEQAAKEAGGAYTNRRNVDMTSESIDLAKLLADGVIDRDDLIRLARGEALAEVLGRKK